jgi:SAM-dependent methyltransferase
MSDPYSEGYGLFFPDSRIISKLVPFINRIREIDSQIKILDIGCGLGNHSYITDIFDDVLYFGVDISEIAIERAIETSAKRYNRENIFYFASDFEKFLENTTLTFDIFVDRASLQHHVQTGEAKNLARIFELMKSKSDDSGSYLFSLWASEINNKANVRFKKFFPFEQALPILKKYCNCLEIEVSTNSLLTNDEVEIQEIKEFITFGRIDKEVM